MTHQESKNRMTRVCRPRRRGLSLLEVILSIAILGGSMVVIGHIYNLGYRSAIRARLRSEANLYGDTILAELAAGAIAAESTGETPIVGAVGWNYAIELEDSSQPGLFLATVLVTRTDESNVLPNGVSFVRFLVDPDYIPEEDEE